MTETDLIALCARLTLEEKVLVLTGRDSWSTHPLPSIGLRSMTLSDGPAGVRGDTWDERSPSINFPSPTAVAASWDPEMVRRVGEGLGQEAVRKGVHVLLAPTINLQRTPFGGRHFEAFSEDPLLTSAVATEYVRGVQAHGVGATVKHYVANDSETDRFTVDVRVDDRTLRELYLSAFEGPIVDGDAWLVMSAYNSVNGARATENDLLTTPLESEWGFDGVVVSDWTAVRSLDSARFPQDLVMPGPTGPWGDALVAAVRAGDIDESLVDAKVIRILRLAARVGALDGAAPPVRAPEIDAHRVARDASVAGTVLLRNDGILPLAAPSSIAVVGEAAMHARTQGGGSATVIPDAIVSPLDGIRRRWPAAQVTWRHGAIVEKGLADLPADTFRAPSGVTGMLVRYLAGDGSETASEERRTSRIVSFDAASLAVNAAIVEFHLTYRPGDDAETFAFGVTGLCDFEVLVDGEVAATGALRTAPGDDPAAAVLHPPSTALSLPRSAPTVDIVVRLRPVEGGIPDALSLGVGIPPRADDPQKMIDDAAAAAAAAEIAVVVVSTSAEVESEGFDRTTLRLPGHQDALVRAVAAVNPRTVVVVNSGSPVTLPWIDEVSAALAVWFPGQEAGAALAAVLSGDEEPGGRLPMSWPADEESVPVSQVQPLDGRLEYAEGLDIGYRAWDRADAAPLFPFGSGHGYTTWQAAITDVRVGKDATTAVTLTARNTGKRPGKSVLQLYAERVSPSTWCRPQRSLVGFAPVVADAGDEVTIAVSVPRRALAVYTPQGWIVEPGEYRLVLGFAHRDDADAATMTIPDRHTA